MIIDSSTPRILWQSSDLSIHADDRLSTGTLRPSGILPKQKLVEESECPSSLWAGGRTKGSITTNVSRRFESVAPKLSKPSPTHDEAVLLKKWDGFVTAILDDGFAARFGDDSKADEIVDAEFDFSELGDSDREILAEGMPLVWCISRERSNGGIKRCSNIYLRRQSPPSKAEIAAAARNLDEWFASSTPDTSR